MEFSYHWPRFIFASSLIGTLYLASGFLVLDFVYLIFSGDYLQTDFKYDDEKNGIYEFMRIIERLNDFNIVHFGWEDIVRSDFVRDYIMTKEMLNS